MWVAFPLAGVSACFLGLSGCNVSELVQMDKYHEDFHYTYQVQPKARIDVESFNGAIEIEGWDRNEVEVSGSKFASSIEARDALRIDIHHTSDSVEIRAVKPADKMGSMGATLTLHVPNNAEVDRVTTSNGHIEIRDVARAAHLKSSNGAIKLTNVPGDVDAHTSNGPIDTEGLSGEATLKTSNGHIHADKMTGSLEAETSNSGIVAEMDASPSVPLKLTSSNGPIELTLNQAPRSDIKATTRNGPITVHLPANTSARITADTSNSTVTSDFTLTGENEKGHLKGNIGTGGHDIELGTSNGHIRIVKGAGD